MSCQERVTNRARQVEDNRFSALLANLASGSNTLTITATDGNTNTATNRYTIVIGTNSAAQALTYDADGNMTVDAVYDRVLSWDAKNRLTQTTRGTNTTQISYDGLDRWVQIVEKAGTVTNAVKRFVWCGLELCEERDAGGAVVKRFFPQGAEDAGGERLFYTRDHLGSVREMVDNSGAVRASYSYDPWGRVTKTSGDRDADFAFTGHYYHAGSGLHLAPYRAYSADLGRWVSRDRIAENGGINPYGYCANNPNKYIDSTGEIPTAIAGALLGAAVGGSYAALTGGDIAQGALTGAVSGGLAGLGVPPPLAAAFGGALGGGLNAYKNCADAKGIAANAMIGGGIGAFTGHFVRPAAMEVFGSGLAGSVASGFASGNAQVFTRFTGHMLGRMSPAQ